MTSTSYARRPDDRRWPKARAVALRRLPAVLVTLLVVAAAYLALGLRSAITYDAEALLYVPANVAGQQPPGDQDAAVKLAKTYAAALPYNADLVAGAAQRSGEPVSYVQSHLTFTSDPGTSLLTVKYSGTSAKATSVVLGFVWRSLTSANPPKPVSAGSVKVVNLPNRAVVSGQTLGDRLPLAISLGLVAGLGLAYVLETLRPRIDTVRECHGALGIPVTWWGQGAESKVLSWASRGERSSALLELVPADRRSERIARGIEAQLSPAPNVRTPHQTFPNRSDRGLAPRLTASVRPLHDDEDGGEDNPRSSCTVLVVREGILRSAAEAAVETLAQQSREPSGAVFADQHGAYPEASPAAPERPSS